MKIQILNQLKEAVVEITPDKLHYLVQTISDYRPGGFADRFAEKVFFILGDCVQLNLTEPEPTLLMFETGVGVNESFTWEGISFKSDTGDMIFLRFKSPFVFKFQNFIDLVSYSVYPRQCHYPSDKELLDSISSLFIDNLGSIPVLYYFIKNQKYLHRKFEFVYQAMGPGPFHEGVIKLIAKEPINHSGELNSLQMSSEQLNRKTAQQHRDIPRCYTMKIHARGKTWSLEKEESAENKIQLYETAMKELEKMNCLPASVLKAFQLGTHQSGFFNEAAIAVGVWLTVTTQNTVIPLDTGFKRESEFVITNQKIEAHDHCEWHCIAVPPEFSSRTRTPAVFSNEERQIKYLSKPMILTYRYTVSESEGELSFRVKELSLKNKSEIVAKAAKKVVHSPL